MLRKVNSKTVQSTTENLANVLRRDRRGWPLFPAGLYLPLLTARVTNFSLTLFPSLAMGLTQTLG